MEPWKLAFSSIKDEKLTLLAGNVWTDSASEPLRFAASSSAGALVDHLFVEWFRDLSCDVLLRSFTRQEDTCLGAKIDLLRILCGPEPWPTSVSLPNCAVTLLLETQSGAAAPDIAAEIQRWVDTEATCVFVCWRWQHRHADLWIKYFCKVRVLFQRLSWRKIWSLGESIYFHLDLLSSRPWYPIVVSVL